MIFRIRKTSHYVTINNKALRDDRLSWCARGILAYLLTLPDAEIATIDKLTEKAKEGRRRVQSALKELETTGYFQRVRQKTAQGKWQWEINVFEECTENHTAGNGQMENHLMETAPIKDIKTKKEKTNPLPPFQTPDFIHALTDYHHSRVEQKHRPLGLVGLTRLYADLASWGELAAIEALKLAVRNGWQGVYPPKANSATVGTYRRPEVVV